MEKNPMPQESLSFIQKIQEMGVWGYAWLLFVASWAGTVKYLKSLKAGESPTLIGWLIDVIASGFVGVVAASICQHYELGFYATSAITGVAAHNGIRTLYLIENYLKAKYPGIKKIDE